MTAECGGAYKGRSQATTTAPCQRTKAHGSPHVTVVLYAERYPLGRRCNVDWVTWRLGDGEE